MNTGLLRHAVATVLTVYGIETARDQKPDIFLTGKVATVLTVYGIETWLTIPVIILVHSNSCNSAYRLRY